MPIFVNSAMVLRPMAGKRIMDVFLDGSSKLRVSSAPNVDAEIYSKLEKSCMDFAYDTFVELKEKQMQQNEESFKKYMYALELRQEAAEHIGIENIRRSRLQKMQKEKSHIGYVVTAYFSDFKGPCTTVCSPLDTDTIIGGVVYRKPGFGNVMEKRDTFDLRETDSNNSFDCLNTYITYQLTRFDKAHFDRFVSRKLGNDFIGAEMKTGKHRLWQTRIVESPTLFHHEMLVQVPSQSYPQNSNPSRCLAASYPGKHCCDRTSSRLSAARR